jgi:hypothetical protein
MKQVNMNETPEPESEPQPALDPRAFLQAFSVLLAQAQQQKPARPPEPLEPHENERDRQLAYWASEPKVRTMIPIEDEKERQVARTHGGKYPTRYMVNGVAYDTWKGITIDVPQSIADLIAYCQNPWAYRDGDKPDDRFDADEAYQRLVLGAAPR